MEGFSCNISTTTDMKKRLSISCKVVGKDYLVNRYMSFSLYNIYRLTPIIKKQCLPLR